MEGQPSKPPSFNPSIPEVHSISGSSLQQEGWVRNGSTYTKDGSKITYDGVTWLFNGNKVEFMEQLKPKK